MHRTIFLMLDQLFPRDIQNRVRAFAPLTPGIGLFAELFLSLIPALSGQPRPSREFPSQSDSPPALRRKRGSCPNRVSFRKACNLHAGPLLSQLAEDLA